MAVRNAAKFVFEACESVLLQTFRDFELVIIDDGSTDGTHDVLRRIRDPRLRLIAREGRGLIATRNELLDLARAPLIAWMDADDRSRPERLAMQVDAFERNADLVCLGGAVLEMDEAGRPIAVVGYPLGHQDIWLGMMRGGAMRFPATMMRASDVRRLGGFREPFRIGEDLDLFLRLHEVGAMANLQDILLDYRILPSGSSGRFAHAWSEVRDVILKLALERRFGGSDSLQRGERLVLAALDRPGQGAVRPLWRDYCAFAWRASIAGFHETAFHYAARSVLAKPLRPEPWAALIKLGIRALGRTRGSAAS